MSERIHWRDYYIFLLLLLFGSWPQLLRGLSTEEAKLKHRGGRPSSSCGTPGRTGSTADYLPCPSGQKTIETTTCARTDAFLSIETVVSRALHLGYSRPPAVPRGMRDAVTILFFIPNDVGQTSRSSTTLVFSAKALGSFVGRSNREGNGLGAPFLHYDPIQPVGAKKSSPVEMLLPDGLHVDTNNGYLFGT